MVRFMMMIMKTGMIESSAAAKVCGTIMMVAPADSPAFYKTITASPVIITVIIIIVIVIVIVIVIILVVPVMIIMRI